ncbi:hypothetical protein [Okeania sp. SIO2B3]|uniref:hypothetical protein n=1 Tax=Okeania sp. SIO2B3 TaxID=2607784 RepID=UPI0025D0C4F1|nr:hypothetical protein [Okeania sp. SIO2B3]
MKTRLLKYLKGIAFSALTVGCSFMTYPAFAVSFTDNFDDGIVDSRYIPIEGAILSEEAGQMTANLGLSGDGVLIDFNDVVPNAVWYMINFEIEDFLPEHALEIDYQLFDENNVHFETVRFTYAFPSDDIALNPGIKTKQWKEVFKLNEDGEFEKDEKLSEHKELEVEIKEFDMWFDVLPSGNVFVENHITKEKSINKPEKKPKYTKVRYRVKNNQVDPQIIFNSAGAADATSIRVHTPEPASTLGFLALCTLGAASKLKHKLKPSKSTQNKTEKVS